MDSVKFNFIKGYKWFYLSVIVFIVQTKKPKDQSNEPKNDLSPQPNQHLNNY